MRDLRFRAWDNERMVMIDGTDIEEAVDDVDEISYSVEVTRYHTGLSYGKLFVAYYDKKGDWQECPVMQFTGLHDKNGKEVYEGDVVLESAPRGNKYRVISVPGGFAINTFQDEIAKPLFYEALADMQTQSYVTSQCEVIGNCYENPELVTP